MSDNNPMVEFITDAAGKAFEKAVEAISKRVRKAFKNQDAKEQIEFGIAYEDYLYNTLLKYGMVKTLINRYVPKPLESLYYPIGVRYDGQYIDTSKVTNLFRYGNKIIITGTGGIGKTIMMKYFFLNTAQETEYIPVMLELRSFNAVDRNKISIKDTIWKILRNYGFELDYTYFEDSLKVFRYVFLLDGFEEIRRDRIEILANEILEFSDSYPDNKYILTSRPLDERFIGFNNFCEMSECCLSQNQAVAMIQKIDFDARIKEKFCSELKNGLFEKYKSFASIPLLLMILLLTYGRFASIPDNMIVFYERAFSTLFREHDASKDIFHREIRSGLGSEDFKTTFSYICLKTYFTEVYEFTESELKKYIQIARNNLHISFTVNDFLYDLTTSVCLFMKDDLVYRFQHGSFQEYFAAWYTCKLSDVVQQRLINKAMVESKGAICNSYLYMLFYMQSGKVNSLIFAPILREVKEDYDKYGFSIRFLEPIYHSINVLDGFDGTERGIYTITVTNNRDTYNPKSDVLNLTVELNRLHTTPNTFENNQSIASKLYIACLQNEHHYLRFREAAEVVGETALLEELKWIKRDVELALDFLKNMDEKKAGEKDTIAGILDEI